MKLFKKKRKVVGIVVERMNWYYIITEDGVEYKLYAIKQQEAVAPDYNIGKFAKLVGKKVVARGQIQSGEIWGARLFELGREESNLGGLGELGF